jgi:hypothetical protein
MNINSKFLFLIPGLVALLIIPLAGCSIVQGIFQNPRYIYENGAVLVGGDEKPIELVNSPNTVNVSYAQLLEFIRQDPTDQLQYVGRNQSSGLTPFVCSDFAEEVHNNAEEVGIRAGYVGIDWEEGGLGHAVNAFETTDQGLVYIDCTGPGIFSQLDTSGGPVSNTSWDKVAYLEIGQRFGVLSLDKAISTSYEFYQDYELKWENYKLRLEAYNSKVKQYNQDIEDKVFQAGSREAREIQLREVQLKAEKQDLDARGSEIGTSSFKPLGIVKSITLFW